MSPTSRLLTLAFAWLLLATVAAALPVLMMPWLWLGVIMAVAVVTDAVVVRFRKPLEIERRLPGRFALGESGEVRLILRNQIGRAHV